MRTGNVAVPSGVFRSVQEMVDRINVSLMFIYYLLLLLCIGRLLSFFLWCRIFVFGVGFLVVFLCLSKESYALRIHRHSRRKRASLSSTDGVSAISQNRSHGCCVDVGYGLHVQHIKVQQSRQQQGSIFTNRMTAEIKDIWIVTLAPVSVKLTHASN